MKVLLVLFEMVTWSYIGYYVLFDSWIRFTHVL